MAVYKRTYKAYKGPLTPAWSRFSVLSRYGLANLFDSRPFTAYTVLCFLPFLVGLVVVYFVNSSIAQEVLHIRISGNTIIDNRWFAGFLAVEFWMGFILTAWCGPGLISKDFANHSVQLYLSRPLSRAEYLFGKVSVLGALLACTTLVPALVLFFVQAQLQGHGWIWENLWMAGSIVLVCVIWIASISLLSMAISVWVRWRIAATGLLLSFTFLLPVLGQVTSFVLRTRWGHVIDFPMMLAVIAADLFRVTPNNIQAGGFEIVPLWAAWASLLCLCAFCVWLLQGKLRAREVERS